MQPFLEDGKTLFGTDRLLCPKLVKPFSTFISTMDIYKGMQGAALQYSIIEYQIKSLNFANQRKSQQNSFQHSFDHFCSDQQFFIEKSRHGSII